MSSNTVDLAQVLALLDQLEASIATIRTILNRQLNKSPPRKRSSTVESQPITELGPIPDYLNPAWPQAIPPNLIMADKGDPVRQYRAMQITRLIGIPLENKRVLDCGCGDGFTTQEIAKRATIAVGFDRRQFAKWINGPRIQFTTQKDHVVKYAPYNLIILYDVLDHLYDDEPVAFLSWLASLLGEQGMIYVRTHPWTAKHGGHAYDKINKAFLHLALTPDELTSLGISVDFNLQIVRPMAAYEKWFQDAKLQIANKNIQRDEIDQYFSGPLLDRIIKITWNGKIDHSQALKIMANSFFDYRLVRL